MKMNGLRALTFATAVLLVTANRLDSFNDNEKQLINRLIKTANEQFSSFIIRHIDYSHKLPHDEYSKAHLRILLKPTTCPRQTSNLNHRPDCTLRSGTNIPEIDCIACHFNFVHCEVATYLIRTKARRVEGCEEYVFGQHGISQTWDEYWH